MKNYRSKTIQQRKQYKETKDSEKYSIRVF